MPFDASTAIRADANRSEVPTAHRMRAPAAGGLAAAAMDALLPASPAPASSDFASVPFYSPAFPRPVAAIAPRRAGGVL